MVKRVRKVKKGNKVKKVKKDDGLIEYKKIGGGSLRFDGKIIKPNQTFFALKDKIPLGFKDVVIPVAELKFKKSTVKKVSKYKLVNIKGKVGWFDIYDGKKKLNEKALNRKEGEKMLKSLQE